MWLTCWTIFYLKKFRLSGIFEEMLWIRNMLKNGDKKLSDDFLNCLEVVLQRVIAPMRNTIKIANK